MTTELKLETIWTFLFRMVRNQLQFFSAVSRERYSDSLNKFNSYSYDTDYKFNLKLRQKPLAEYFTTYDTKNKTNENYIDVKFKNRQFFSSSLNRIKIHRTISIVQKKTI